MKTDLLMGGSNLSIKHPHPEEQPLRGRELSGVEQYRRKEIMQTKIKSSESSSDSESGLVVERRFSICRTGPIRFIRMDRDGRGDLESDGSMADSIEGVKLPSGFTGVPGKVCAQKYLRKAGVPKFLRNVPEDGVPIWLQRSEPDHERLQNVDAAERMGGEIDEDSSSVDSQGPGPTGAGSTATSRARLMPARTSTRCAT